MIVIKGDNKLLCPLQVTSHLALGVTDLSNHVHHSSPRHHKLLSIYDSSLKTTVSNPASESSCKKIYIFGENILETQVSMLGFLTHNENLDQYQAQLF